MRNIASLFAIVCLLAAPLATSRFAYADSNPDTKSGEEHQGDHNVEVRTYKLGTILKFGEIDLHRLLVWRWHTNHRISIPGLDELLSLKLIQILYDDHDYMQKALIDITYEHNQKKKKGKLEKYIKENKNVRKELNNKLRKIIYDAIKTNKPKELSKFRQKISDNIADQRLINRRIEFFEDILSGRGVKKPSQ